jgi:exosortase/archaeosortase family protein
MSKLKEVLEKKGFIEFLVKSLIFIGILLAQVFFIFWKENGPAIHAVWIRLNVYGLGSHTSIRVILFAVLAFGLLSYSKLLDIKKYEINLWVTIPNLIFSFIFTYLLKIFRATIGQNPQLINNYFWQMFFLKFFLPAMIMATLFLAIFGFDTIVFFYKKLKTQITISAVYSLAFFEIINIFQKAWPYFSRIIVEAIAFLLRLSSFSVVKDLSNMESPGLLVNGLNILIGKGCSGIDSQMLFIFLYSILIFVDWTEINKKKAFLLFIPGLIGMFCVNILRIYLLFLMALLVSIDFALSAFHSNIGWILFVLYFVAFEYFTYSWIRK